MDNSVGKDCEILVVEDNAVDAMFIEKTLRNSKIAETITVTTNGKIALDYLLGEASYQGRRIEVLPKLIFLDLKLPQMDGFEFLHHLRSYQKFKDIPVVIFTGSIDEHDKKMALSLGADSYYTKPLNIHEFISIIEEAGRFWLHSYPIR
jgi:CheY-like chemotaxis protein